MKKLKLIMVSLLLAISVSETFAQRVGAYYANWTGYVATQAQYAKLTDVYWSFLIPNTSGGLNAWQSWENDRFAKFKADCPSTVRKKISVGGDGITSFSNIMANSSARSTFATNLANFVQTHNLDGVDIDWEYPKAAEAANFALFLADLNSKLDAKATTMGKPLELSIAVFSTNAYGTEGITAAVINAVDYINIMAYDNNQETNHSTYAWATGTDVVGFWKSKVPMNKLVLGLPFYGRPALSPNSWNGQDIKEFKSVSAANINNDSEGGYYYNGKATIKSKAQYALTNGMLGVMFWELSQDRTDADALLNVIDGEIKSFGCTKPEFSSLVVPICGQTSVTLNPSNSSIISTGHTYVWKKNGNQVATTLSYSATDAGTYELSVTKTGTSPACVKTATVLVSGVFTKPNLGTDIPVCAGQTVDLDAGVVYSGVNYNWTKDGSAIAPKTQKITGQSAGTYVVSLSDPKSKCTNTAIDTVLVQTGQIKVKGDTTCIAGGKVSLKVLTAGGPYSWYDAQTGGNFQYSGGTLDTNIQSTKSYWVGNSGGSVSAKFGWAYDQAKITAGLYKVPGADFGSETRLKLNVKQKATIDSATVYINGSSYGKAGTVVFTVYNSNNSTVYKTVTVNISGSSNGGIGKQRVPVGIEIDPGASAGIFYLGHTCTSGNTTVFNGITEKNTWGTNFAYPFTTDFIDITATVAKEESNFGLELKNWYAGLYDIRVSTGASCPRVEIKGTVLNNCAVPTGSISASPTNVPRGTSTTFSANVASGMNGAYITSVSYQIKNSSNAVIDTKVGQGNNWGAGWTTDANTPVGTYTIIATITDNKGASTTKTTTVTVETAIGLEEFAEAGINIAPNPFENNFNLNVPSTFGENVSVNIYNAVGSLVSSSNSNSENISLGDNLSSGLYIVEVSNGAKTVRARIIKK
jgi:GH18 family chitinase